MQDPLNFARNNNLKYEVIHRKDKKKSHLLNQTYHFWKQLWVNECASVNKFNEIFADDFFRADLIAVIYSPDQIVGCHLYTYFDLSNPYAREHTYFAGLYNHISKILETENIKEVISLEYLSINPNWRKSITGYALADVLIKLSQNVVRHFKFDAGIGTARLLTKVDKKTSNLGFTETDVVVDRHGFECKFMYYKSESELPKSSDTNVEILASYLWNTYLDKTNDEIQQVA